MVLRRFKRSEAFVGWTLGCGLLLLTPAVTCASYDGEAAEAYGRQADVSEDLGVLSVATGLVSSRRLCGGPAAPVAPRLSHSPPGSPVPLPPTQVELPPREPTPEPLPGTTMPAPATSHTVTTDTGTTTTTLQAPEDQEQPPPATMNFESQGDGAF